MPQTISQPVVQPALRFYSCTTLYRAPIFQRTVVKRFQDIGNIGNRNRMIENTGRFDGHQRSPAAKSQTAHPFDPAPVFQAPFGDFLFKSVFDGSALT